MPIKRQKLVEALQDLIDFTNEINWDDEDAQDLYAEDLITDLKNLGKDLFAMAGYQTWNGK